MELEELNEEMREFCEAREWGQFHSPKDLGIRLVTALSELVEEFRFKDEADQLEILEDPQRREAVEAKLADVLFFFAAVR